MRSKRIALIGMFAAAAIVLSFLENGIMDMLNLAIPGAKPGIANLAVLLALYYLGPWPAALIAAVKCTAVFLATGAATTLLFSIGGTVLSLLGMVLIKRSTAFTPAGVSALGGFLNNFGQLCVMSLLGGSWGFFAYMPVNGAFGTLFGLLIGVLTSAVMKRLPEGKVKEWT